MDIKIILLLKSPFLLWNGLFFAKTRIHSSGHCTIFHRTSRLFIKTNVYKSIPVGVHFKTNVYISTTVGLHFKTNVYISITVGVHFKTNVYISINVGVYTKYKIYISIRIIKSYYTSIY